MDSNWVLVFVTIIYVIATILICIANFKSAKATKDQIRLSEKQFRDSNRAFVTVDFEVIRGGLVALKISNNGKQIAQNVMVRINPCFIEKVDDKPGKKSLLKLNESSFTIGISQSWYTCIGTHLQLEKMGEEELTINLSYYDCFGSYSEIININLSEYFWALIYTSPEADIHEELEKSNRTISSIDRSIKHIAKVLPNSKSEDKNA